MDDDDHWWQSDFIRVFLAPVGVALLTGLGGGYVGTQVALAQHGQRIKALEGRVSEVEESQDAHADSFSTVSDRLTRLETKIDLLLDDRIKLDQRREEP